MSVFVVGSSRSKKAKPPRFMETSEVFMPACLEGITVPTGLRVHRCYGLFQDSGQVNKMLIQFR